MKRKKEQIKIESYGNDYIFIIFKLYTNFFFTGHCV